MTAIETATAVAPRTTAPAVEVRSLTKRFGSYAAVDDLTFNLERGSVTGLLGPNGAGKSTTLRVLLGLAMPTSGEALVFGRPYRELEEPVRRVGALLESNDFHPARSGRDHLRCLALAAELSSSRVDEVLDEVELTRAARQRVGTYSLGMRQRLGLAGALLGGPDLLVLDEPANGLDAAGVRWLRALLRRQVEGGGTVVLSSHALAEIAQIVDQVVIIDEGRLVAATTVADLTSEGTTFEDAYLDLTTKEPR
jgi:ABC-2 type transport system ATP-binding protein